MWIPVLIISAYLCFSIAFLELRRRHRKPRRLLGYVRFAGGLIGYSAMLFLLESRLHGDNWFLLAIFGSIGFLCVLHLAPPRYWFRFLNRRFAHSFFYGVRGKHRMHWKPKKRRMEIT